MVRKAYKRLCLRGDTDFSLTAHFDRWTERGVDFVFGVDAMRNLVEFAGKLDENRWSPMVRKPKYEVKTSPRKRPENVKEAIVRRRGYENITLQEESVAALAWNMKAWFGLLMEDRRHGQTVVRMEFRRFVNLFIKLPCQIVRAGRRIIFRVLGYNTRLKDFLHTFLRIKAMKFR